jgi:dynein regulatory complex subunit 2
MALRNHLIHVNELIDLQSSRLRGLDEEFERDVEIIRGEFDGEKADIDRSHRQERRELKDMIETIEEEENNKLDEMKEAYDSGKEETKNKNVEDLESMKHELIKKIEELDKEFEVSFTKYIADTDNKAT